MMVASTAWGVMEVLADFEDESTLDYMDKDTNTMAASTDTPPGTTSAYSCKVTITDWYQWDNPPDPATEFYCGLEFASGKDFTAYAYLNYYIKGTSSTTVNSRWNSSIINAGADGMGFAQEAPALPAAWTYVSVPIAEFTSFWGNAHDMSATWHLEWGFGQEEPSTMEVFIDHVTLSTTPEEGELAEGPPPADCDDPFLAQSGLAVSGEPFSILVAGVDEGCVDSVSWEKDGVPIEEGEPCVVIDPPEAGVGQMVVVDDYDSWGNKLDLSRDVEYADVGFAKTYPRSLRFDYMTLSDTPEAGMLGAVGGNVYVVSAMEEGDIPNSLSGGGLITTDSAGAGSTACVEVPVMWGSWIWAEYYGANVDVSCCAQYLNFYVKVADGGDWEGNASAGIGGNDNWDSGFWQDDAFTYPGSGQGWKYVSIAIGGESVWGDPDWTTVAAVGIEFSDWNAQGDFYSFSTPEIGRAHV